MPDDRDETEREREQREKYTKQIRGVERAIEELIVELDVGMKRSLAVQQDYFKTQTANQRLTTGSILAVGAVIATLMVINMVHHW
jgi:hypothetical protein